PRGRGRARRARGGSRRPRRAPRVELGGVGGGVARHLVGGRGGRAAQPSLACRRGARRRAARPVPRVADARRPRRERDRADRRGRTPRSLRVAVTGSAPIPPPLLRRMLTTLGLERVHAGYGLTEATGVCTITRAGDPLELVAESSGRAVEGVDVRIVDEEGAPVPSGRRGEIHVRGPGVMHGYFDD